MTKKTGGKRIKQERGEEAQPTSFDQMYPTIARWVTQEEGWIAIGADDYSHSLDRALYGGGLHEGWAESQSGMGSLALARRALEQQSSNPSLGIRDMAETGWYHRDAGPVYPLGGAFVDHIIKVYGVKSFQRLYNECRPGRFEATCREVLGTDLDALEAKFWDDAQRQVAGSA